MGAAVALLMGAGDEGVDAFQPVHQAELHQLVERPVDLQRCPEPLVAQKVEYAVGR